MSGTLPLVHNLPSPHLLVPESNGGMYLTRRGDFNAGAKISTFLRIRCKSSAPLGAPREIKALMAEKRHVTFFGEWFTVQKHGYFGIVDDCPDLSDPLG